MTYERPPSAYRPPSSNVSSNMRPPSRFKEKDLTDHGRPISVANRLTSSNGLQSATSHGGTRLVLDKSYCIGLVRTKINEITKEIERLQNDINSKKVGQGLQTSLQQKVNELSEEISNLESELADYNVLKDRIQNKVGMEDLQLNYNETVENNRQLEGEVNKLYRENKKLLAVVNQQEAASQSMQRDDNNPQIQQLKQEIDQLEREAKVARGSGGDLKGKSKEELLQIVKEVTANINEIDRRIQEEQKNLQYIKNQNKILDEREAELQSERGKKYLTLLEREKSMNTYLLNYPQNLENVKKEIQEHQEIIQDILMKTAQEIENLAKIPTHEDYQQIQDDIKVKIRSKNDAQSTLVVLQQQVDERRQELENLKDVDKGIDRELIELQKQMDDMRKKMPDFEDVEAVRSEGEAKKQLKEQERDRLKVQLSNVKKATNTITIAYNDGRNSLRSNPLHTKIHDFEKEIANRAKENYAIVEFLEENRRKTNFSLIKREVMSIVESINSKL